MTRKELEQKMWSDANLLDHLTNKQSHMTRHINVPDKNMMERVFDEVDAVSTFQNADKAEYAISESVLYKMQQIFDTLPKLANGDEFGFDVYFDPNNEEDKQPIGRGFMIDKHTNIIREYTTNTLRLVLTHDDHAKYGFAIKTAYPNIYTPDVTPTNRNLFDIAKQTHQYQSADPTKRAYMMYRTDPNNTHLITYKAGQYASDSVVSLHVPTENPNTKHVIRIKEDEIQLATMCDHEKIASKYTQLRDQLRPEYSYLHYNVNLRNPELKKAFQNDYPTEVKQIGTLYRTIRDEKTQTTIQQTHKQRVTQAEQLSTNITEQILQEDSQKY